MAAAAARVHRTEGGSDLSGQLRISVSEGFGNSFIAPRLAGFVAAHPEIEIDLVSSSGFLRSEEPTSELQSLMRSSYAVLCLKKNITTSTATDFIPHH